MPTIDAALTIAVHAHKGQRDKAGKAYILHPLRLMLQCASEQEMIVAVLHDALEDSPLTLKELENEGFSPAVLAALDCLTRRKSEDYQDFIQRVSTNALATQIKIKDLTDNLDTTRLNSLSEQTLARIEKYHKALHYLRAHL